MKVNVKSHLQYCHRNSAERLHTQITKDNYALFKVLYALQYLVSKMITLIPGITKLAVGK